jgi:O-antigen ligase
LIVHRQTRKAPDATPAREVSRQPVRAAALLPVVQSPFWLPRILLSAFILLIYTRLVEFLPIKVLAFLGLILLGYGLLTSRWLDWMTAKPTLLFAALTVWMVPSALFGDWPGGSLDLIVNLWGRSILCYFIVVSVARGRTGADWMMSTMAWSTASVVLAALGSSGNEDAVRFALAGGSLSNPNDLAFALVVGLPFCAWYALGSERSRPLRLLMAAAIAAVLVMLLRTGSRGGLLAMICIAAALAFTARGKLRFVVLAATFVIAVAAIVVVPQEIRHRYATIVDDNADETADAADALEVSHAIGSSQARWALLVTSLRVTLHNPVFGVGIGNFTGANAALTKRSGQRVSWQVTHNSYTQVSSECGIPAALIFLGIVFYCLRTTNRLRKAARRHPELNAQAAMAFWLFAAFVAYACSASFNSYAFSYYLPILAGIVVSLERPDASVYPRAAAS